MKILVDKERLEKVISFIDDLTCQNHDYDDDPCKGCPMFDSCQCASTFTCQGQLMAYLCE